jgi:CHASE2 domain-containing sensor protein
VNLKAVTEKKAFQPALGAALTVVCGLALWRMPLGEPWVNASYDYLFRFGARTVTNQVVLILMDNAAHDELHQPRDQPWDRGRHAELLDRLAADGCPLVVFDSFFETAGEPAKDLALAEAMRRLKRVVLMAWQEEVTHPGVLSAEPTLPAEPFLSAAGTNYGVAWLDPDLDSIVRRHWPFSTAVQYHSLPWTAAVLEGAQLDQASQGRWLRYYGQYGAWTALSYHVALAQASNYFHDKAVFIGNEPATSLPDGERDEFRTPYTRWTKIATGGVEIMATEFLNLMNGDWLRRPAWWVELAGLVASGALLGGGLCRFRRLTACGLSTALALAVTLAAVSFSHVTNYWFPWLVIAAGQVPCAFVFTLAAAKPLRKPPEATKTVVVPSRPADASAPAVSAWDLPDAPDYELFTPAFGEGAYGRVWVARNAVGQWQALKAVYEAKFGPRSNAYEREFTGIQNYKPISDKHPGLLRVDFVCKKKKEGYFYYVMELGDALEPGWEGDPRRYAPLDLARAQARVAGRRLPAWECVRIGLNLAEALGFLHNRGLTHRDIKPQNIIFVNGQPKLADVGLVAEVLPPGKDRTWVGTPGYMPPPTEPPGTVQADIFGLGMVLYVILTGREPGFFPEITTTLLDKTNVAGFMRLNAVILKACDPDKARRYASAEEMTAALQQVQTALTP